MKFDLHIINPYIRVAMRSVLPSGTEIYRRIIFDYELLYVGDGEFLLTYDEKDYVCSKGQFVLLRPGVSHRFSEINEDLLQPHLHFDMTYSAKSAHTPICFSDLPDLTEQERELITKDIFSQFPSQPFIDFKDKSAAIKLFYEVIDTPDEKELTKKAKLIELIEMLIADNFPELLSESYNKYTVEQQLKDYIDAGYGFSQNLEDFEKQFSYSKYHLERKFKQRYGMSIISYRNLKRIKAAEKMLEDYSVSRVASKLGFSSIYVFSRAFKKHFGVCPSKFIS